MVLVGVADDHTHQRRVGLGQPVHGGQRDVLTAFGGEWAADVEHKAVAARLDLDAAPADLVGTPVDADPHGAAESLRRQCRLVCGLRCLTLHAGHANASTVSMWSPTKSAIDRDPPV